MPGGSKKGGGLISSATYKLAAENPDTGTTGARGGTMAKSTGYAPFKMKGSPMQRNFGIGSPAKKEEGSMNEAGKEHKHEDHHDKETGAAEGMAEGMPKTGSPAKLKPGKGEKIKKPKKVNKSGTPS